MFLKLYHSTKQGVDYFVNDENLSCSKCKGRLSEVCLIQMVYNKKSSEINIFCQYCMGGVKPSGRVSEEIRAVIAIRPPKTAIPRLICPPAISDSSHTETTFAAAEISTDYTDDQAIRSKVYPSLEGASVGKDIKQLENNKDRAIGSDQEFNALMGDILSAEPMIDEKKAKRIEVKDVHPAP